MWIHQPPNFRYFSWANIELLNFFNEFLIICRAAIFYRAIVFFWFRALIFVRNWFSLQQIEKEFFSLYHLAVFVFFFKSNLNVTLKVLYCSVPPIFISLTFKMMKNHMKVTPTPLFSTRFARRCFPQRLWENDGSDFRCR